jgi:glycosyltransferase involved in cell wall biosynthesis
VDGELIVHGENGLVLPLRADIWAEEVASLLDDKDRWERFSRRSKDRVTPYSYQAAAQGVVAAIRHVSGRR